MLTITCSRRTMFTTLIVQMLSIMSLCHNAYTQVVQLPSDWHVGQTLTIERTRQESHTDGIYKKADSKTTSRITITVIEKDENSYLLRWTVALINDPNQANARISMTRKITELVNAITLYIRTDEHGTPQALEKHDQSIKQINTIIKTITDQLKEHGATDQTIDIALKGVKPLTDPKALEAIALYEPTMLMKMIGQTLILNEPIQSQGHHRNPLGPNNLPAQIQYILTHTNDTNHEAIIEWRKSLDTEKANQILKKMYINWAKKNSNKTTEYKNLPKLKIEESTTYHMDTQTGWPRLVDQQRITINGSKKVIEQITFRLLASS